MFPKLRMPRKCVRVSGFCHNYAYMKAASETKTTVCEAIILRRPLISTIVTIHYCLSYLISECSYFRRSQKRFTGRLMSVDSET